MTTAKFLGYGIAPVAPRNEPRDDGDFIIFRADDDDGTKTTTTIFMARRVWNGEDEVQIEIDVTEVHKTRTIERCASISLDVGQTDALLEHLSRVPEPQGSGK